MAAEPLLEMRDVSAGYGKIQILHNISLEVRTGEIVTVVGPNGAGKSTALKSIMGYVRPTGGEIRFENRNISSEPVHRIVISGIGYVPQGRITFPGMTVLENLEMGAFFIRDQVQTRNSLEKVFSLFPRLAERRRQLAGTMSGGEQQMVAIGRAMMSHPKCIILDEPSLGLSPKFVDLIFSKLVDMRKLGLSLLMVEQNAARALAVSDRGYVLQLGRNHSTDTGATLLNSAEIRQLFIGG